MRHVETWRSFIRRLTVINSERLSDDDAQALAEALSIAAPEGPRGVECEDNCSAHVDQVRVAAVILTSEILERRLEYRERPTQSARLDIKLELYERRGDEETARRLFPRTWSLIDKLAR